MFDPQNPPELKVAAWLNTPEPKPLAALKGKVVVVAAFQTHCKGSLNHGLPQAERFACNFNEDEVAVIGLNTAFEEQTKQAVSDLELFAGEKDFSFPIAKDEPDGTDLPKTMAAYEIQGTPTTLIFDRQGRLRRHYLGQVDDIRLAAEVMALCMESPTAPREQSMAVERRLAAALVDPDEHHHHDGGCCGGHHDHNHDHDHSHHHKHDHTHADGGCGDAGCGCKH
jgi:hypothetical protein